MSDSGGRRVNNVPIYLVGAVAFGFALIMMLVSMDSGDDGEVVTESVGDSKSSADKIVGAYKTGSISPGSALIPPDQPKFKPIEPEPTGVDEEAMLRMRLLILEAERLERLRMEAEGIRGIKLEQFKNAVAANTIINRGGGGRSGASMTARHAMSDDPVDVYKAKIRALGGDGLGVLGGGGSSSGENQTSITGAAADSWRLDSHLDAPLSPYVLRAGFIIPAVLISGINSELPGQIMAQVSLDVYDTAVGRHLLIPQGSRLVGSYSSSTIYGQSRALVMWKRIVFPDGKALDIGSMPGVDHAGYSGLKDKVNNHLIRLYANAILLSAVTAGISLSQDDNDDGFFSRGSDNQRAGDAMSEAMGRELGEVTADLIEKNMNISPTIEIRPGYRLNVMVTKDMNFSTPYLPFDYSRKGSKL